MKTIFVQLRNCMIKITYKYVAKPIFFRFEPETIHDKIKNTLMIAQKNIFLSKLTQISFSYNNKYLNQKVLGINFKNPIGLAAGFDKDGEVIKSIQNIGFGFTEIGSITAQKCNGNDKPRLWRFKKHQSTRVNYGLKNNGADEIYNKLNQELNNNKNSGNVNDNNHFTTGISIAKTNCKECVRIDNEIEDYLYSYKKFENIGDYFTINISCPNAYGGQPFTDHKKLKDLLEKISREPKSKPIFIKLSPDLTKKEIDNILLVTEKSKIIDGFICTNLTKNPKKNILTKEELNIGKGGFSGKLVDEKSNYLIKYIYNKTKEKYIIIACGGVFTAEDAYKKIKLGASLVQLITGMIYGGPQTISEINVGLVKLLKKDKLNNISEAIGLNNNK